MRLVLLTFSVFIFMRGFINSAYAENTGSQAGFVYGMTVPDSDNTNPHFNFGIKGMSYLLPSFSIGGYYILSNEEHGNGGRKFDYSFSGLEGAYHFQNSSGDAYAGLRAGITKVRTISGNTNLILSPYHVGFVAGYDYPVTPWFLLGFEGSYMHVEKSDTTQNAVKYLEDPFYVIGFLLAMQFKL